MFPTPHPPGKTSGWIAAAICLTAIAAVAGPDDKAPRPGPPAEAPGPPDAKDPKQDPLRGIAPEKRERLRETMKKIWTDSAVLQARGEVAAATENYQKALRAAVERTDPEMLEVIEEIRASSNSEFKGFLQRDAGQHRGGHGGRDFRDPFAAIMNAPPPFLKDLTEEQREIYKNARQKATQSRAFQEALKEMEAVREKDNELREERISLFRNLRQILTREMTQADERIKDWLPVPGGPGGPGGMGGKGKGLPGKGRGMEDLPEPPPPGGEDFPQPPPPPES